MNVDRVVSLHFPKAGGTSLVTQFIALLRDEVALDYDHDPMSLAGGEVAPFPAGKLLVHGHFKPQRYACADAFFLTFLREPVANLISIYFYWLCLPCSGHAVHAAFLRERPDIFDFARHPDFSCLMSRTYFGGCDMRRFDFVGFHETRQRDIERLGHRLGLALRGDVHENRAPPDLARDALLQDGSTVRRLRTLLAQDLRFYEDVRAMAA